MPCPTSLLSDAPCFRPVLGDLRLETRRPGVLCGGSSPGAAAGGGGGGGAGKAGAAGATPVAARSAASCRRRPESQGSSDRGATHVHSWIPSCPASVRAAENARATRGYVSLSSAAATDAGKAPGHQA